MALQQIVPDLYAISGQVNIFLLDSPDGVTVIDTGFPGSAPQVLDTLKELKRQPADVRHILLTHAHPDHIGSAAALQQATGAQTYMHPLDTPITRAGTGFRPVYPSPGLLNHLFGALAKRGVKKHQQLDPTRIDHEVADGAVLPIAGGITAIHAPGHCAGQLVFLWPQHGGVLFAADACMNVIGLKITIVYEDLPLGRQTLAKIAQLPFEVAVFGHGKPILHGASTRFRQSFTGK